MLSQCGCSESAFSCTQDYATRGKKGYLTDSHAYSDSSQIHESMLGRSAGHYIASKHAVMEVTAAKLPSKPVTFMCVVAVTQYRILQLQAVQ